jgi:uncharacterized membrane protein YqiK
MLTPPTIIGIVIGVVAVICMLFSLFISEHYHIASHDEILIRTGNGGMKIISGGKGALRIPVLQRIQRLKLTNILIDIDCPWGVFFTNEGQETWFRIRLSLSPCNDVESILKALKAFGIEDEEMDLYLDLDQNKLIEVAKAVLISEISPICKKFYAAELLQNPNSLLSEELSKVTQHIKMEFADAYGLSLKTIAITSLSIKDSSGEKMEAVPDVHDAVGLRAITQIIGKDEGSSNPEISVESSSDNSNCPYCRSFISEGQMSVKCEDCGTTHHIDCFDEHKQCSTFACQSTRSVVGK